MEARRPWTTAQTCDHRCGPTHATSSSAGLSLRITTLNQWSRVTRDLGERRVDRRLRIEPQAKLIMGVVNRYFQHTSEEPRKRPQQKQPRLNDRTTKQPRQVAIKWPRQNDRIGLSLPRHCELLFQIFTLSPACWNIEYDNSFVLPFPTQMNFRAKWPSRHTTLKIISVSLKIFGKRPGGGKTSNLMEGSVTHSWLLLDRGYSVGGRWGRSSGGSGSNVKVGLYKVFEGQ